MSYDTLLERIVGGPPLTVTVGGVNVPLVDVGDVVIRHGRTGYSGPPDPSSCTLYVYASAFAVLPDIGDPIVVQLSTAALTWLGLAPGDAATPRFTGRVSDLAHGGGVDPVLGIIAVSKRARLGDYDRQPTTAAVDYPANIVERWLRSAALSDLALDIGAFAVEAPLLTTLDGTNGVGDVIPSLEKSAGSLNDQIALAGLALAGELVEKRNGQLTWQGPSRRSKNLTPVVTLNADQLLISSQATKDLSQLANVIGISYGIPEAPLGTQPSYAVFNAASRTKHGTVYQNFRTIHATRDFIDHQTPALFDARYFPTWSLPLLSVDLLRHQPDTDDPQFGSWDATWNDVGAGVTWASLALDGPWKPASLYWLEIVAQLLRAEFSDLLQVGPDTGLPLADTRLWLEGWTETYTPTSWRMDLDVSAFASTATYPLTG